MTGPRTASRRTTLLRLFKVGVCWGLLVAMVGLLLGYLWGGQTLKAASAGLNWAAITMFLLPGVFLLGEVSRFSTDQSQLSSGYQVWPSSPIPWARIFVCLVAGVICAVLTLALPLLDK